MSGKSILSRIFNKMNPAGDTVAYAETIEKLERLAVTAENKIEQLKFEVVQIQNTLEENKEYASSVLSTKHQELLEENKKLKKEIAEWKKKVLDMEHKLCNVEVKVGDSISQNEMFLSKISAQGEILGKHGEKIDLQGEVLNKYQQKIAVQEEVLNKYGKKIAAQEEKLIQANEKLNMKEGLSAREKEKKSTNGESPSQKAPSVDVGRLDIRIGKILDIIKHPEADTLYVEQIDVGEEKPRVVVSGLVRFIPMTELLNRMVVVVCNMKPSKMRGILSEAMVLCANDNVKVEVLNPPKGALPGERVLVEGYTSNPDSVLPPKKKIFETVSVDLKTDMTKNATYKGKPFYVPGKGNVMSSTLTNASIK